MNKKQIKKNLPTPINKNDGVNEEIFDFNLFKSKKKLDILNINVSEAVRLTTDKHHEQLNDATTLITETNEISFSKHA